MQLRGSGRGLGTARSVVERFSQELGVDSAKVKLTPGCENVADLNDGDISSVFVLVGQFMNGV